MAATKRWNRKNKLSMLFGKLIIFFFGEYKTYSWKRKKIRFEKKQLFQLIWRDTLATLSGEIRGFGEWRKLIYLRKNGKYCSNSNCREPWEKISLEFHHKRPLAAIQKVFFNTPLRILPTFLVIALANIIANRVGNMELLCLKCHYKAHVLLGRNGHTVSASNLIKSKLEDKKIPIPRI